MPLRNIEILVLVPFPEQVLSALPRTQPSPSVTRVTVPAMPLMGLWLAPERPCRIDTPID